MVKIMSENEIKSQIDSKQGEITRIDGEAKQKKTLAENEINNEFNPKIKDIESKLNGEQGKYDEAVAKLAEWNTKKKDLGTSIKNLEKELSSLNKEKPQKLSTKLKEIDGEAKEKIKSFNAEIKDLQKRLTALKKTPPT
jgi:chromosome segregation ATPase